MKLNITGSSAGILNILINVSALLFQVSLVTIVTSNYSATVSKYTKRILFAHIGDWYVPYLL